MKAMSETKEHATSKVGKSVDQLISELQSESKVIRSRAAESLSNLKFEGEKESEKAVKALERSLNDLDEATRAVVTRALERFKHPLKSK
jgi:HEAT repeat protein